MHLEHVILIRDAIFSCLGFLPKIGSFGPVSLVDFSCSCCKGHDCHNLQQSFATARQLYDTIENNRLRRTRLSLKELKDHF
jgi:hypothetical protein